MVKWLIQEGPDFKGDPEFVYGLVLPENVFYALFGAEYFVRVLATRELDSDLDIVSHWSTPSGSRSVWD